MDILKLSLLISTFLTGLIAGLFYSYSCSVNLGLSKLSDIEYLKAMKSINKEILNPWFFLSFIGSLIMVPFCTWLYYDRVGVDVAFYLVMLASAVYVIGVIGVTVIGNVPLNESLSKFDLERVSVQEIKAKRKGFEIPWNRFHFIRTIANVSAFVLLLLALVIR